MSEVGDLVRTRRRAMGWSQDRLARESGVNQKKISHIETGYTITVDPDAADRLCLALSISIHEMLAAMGYRLPVPRVPRDLLAMLEAAPPPVLDGVRLLLTGWRATQRG